MAQYEMNLSDYVRILRKRKWTIICSFLVVFLASWWSSEIQPALYEASTTVKIVERATVGELLTSLVTYTTGDPIATQAKVITSRPVIERVAEELGLISEGMSQKEIGSVVAGLRGSIETERLGYTNVIQITASSDSSVMAAALANKVAEVFIAYDLAEKRAAATTLRHFLEEQLEEVGLNLKEDEEALKRLREDERATGLAIALQEELTNLRSEVAELLRKYTQKHPNVVALQERIREISEEIKWLPESELELARLTRSQQLNESLFSDLNKKLAAARISEAEKVEDVVQLNPAVEPGSPIRPQKQLIKLMGGVVGLMLGFIFAFIREHLDTSIGAIEDVESYIKLPVLGVIPYIKIGEERRSLLQRRAKVTRKDKVAHIKSQLVIHFSPKDPVAESFKTLRTNIQFAELDKGGKTLLFTSVAPGEGKSLIVVNLAITMAQAGRKTLLVSGDLRRPILHSLFGLTREPGLSNVLIGTAKSKDAIRSLVDMLLGDLEWDEALKVPGMDNLSIMPSGGLPPNPSELLSSPEMAKLIDELKAKFDVIIFDAPPSMAISDTAILGAKMDGVILVYQVGKIARRALLRARLQLENVGVKVKGIVLNHLRPEVAMGAPYYYYHYKYKYYGEKGKRRWGRKKPPEEGSKEGG